jgi:hypothetical protein
MNINHALVIHSIYVISDTRTAIHHARVSMARSGYLMAKAQVALTKSNARIERGPSAKLQQR